MAKKSAVGRSSKPSLKDVAKLANVSVMTVSNVINGRMARVGDEVAARVREAVRELNYRPQRSGRSLRLQKEFALGLTVLHPDRRFLDDPYITQVAAGMSNFLATIGYSLMVNGLRNLKALDTLMERSFGYDGFAVMVSGEREQRVQVYKKLAQLKLPMVVIQDAPPPDLPEVSSVCQDDGVGAGMLVERLIDKRAKRILFAASRQVWPAMERRAAAAVAAAGKRARIDHLSCSEDDFELSIRQIETWLRSHPNTDAVMGGNDQLGLAAMQAAERCGLSVPSELMVTGYNAFLFQKFSKPTLCSVSSPAYEIGQEVSKMLIDLINGDGGEARHLLMPVSVVDGGSIG
ncbi:LacI family DNA-binding transcriptional regulator [Nitratireductor kimnyeongensis]|uniref:LacI family DNA-binding transcriptional regulator n=1 Tax=Nitratireductor kimnyeongensis TaxID=430679 RepID=A0ABW0T843_9HYPH|nr:LacI family DNA-binding transcriptional regulator [Nitratireductor kimnyeongensis]QZZ36168.1 LacI family transcriptional regulator [Nitratireductor kimnyeongensis]